MSIKMLFFNNFKWFFTLLIYLSLSTSSEYITQTKFIKDLCLASGKPIPTTPSQCFALFCYMVLRYYPLDQKVIELKDYILIKELGLGSVTDELQKWRFIFDYIELNFKRVEALLIATNLPNVPRNEVEWELVENYMNDLNENVFEIERKERLGRELSEIFARPMTRQEDYSQAFKELALIYKEMPSSKGMGYLKSLGFTDENYRAMFEKLSEVVFVMMDICKHYACAFEIRRFIEIFTTVYYAGDTYYERINSIILKFEETEQKRFKDLRNFYNNLLSLTNKIEESETDETFKTQWATTWTKLVKIDLKTYAQKARNVEDAILRIWNSRNADEALKLWKEDTSIWSAQNNAISIEADQIIAKLSKLSHEGLSSVTMKKEPLKSDLAYAITLHTHDFGKNDKYKKCFLILTFSTDSYITDLKKRFSSTLPNNPHEITSNDLFCRRLAHMWTLTSIADFHSRDFKKIPKYCMPNVHDYDKYISTLGDKGKRDETESFIRIVMELQPTTTTLQPSQNNPNAQMTEK